LRCQNSEATARKSGNSGASIVRLGTVTVTRDL
jgi:hypothetical protein